MKRIVLIEFICLFCGIQQMMGQTDSYMVKGKLSGMSEDIKIIVFDRQSGDSKFDTLKVENGEFVYFGKADQRQQLTFMRLSQKEQEVSQDVQFSIPGIKVRNRILQFAPLNSFHVHVSHVKTVVRIKFRRTLFNP